MTIIKVKEASFLKFHLESVFKSINRKKLGDEMEFLNALLVTGYKRKKRFVFATLFTNIIKFSNYKNKLKRKHLQ